MCNSLTTPRSHSALPKNFCFCLKPKHNVVDAKELKLLCAEDEQARTCWMTGIRLIKHGSKLRENFKAAMDEVLRLKPASAKGLYIRRTVISTTMGPGITIDI